MPIVSKYIESGNLEDVAKCRAEQVGGSMAFNPSQDKPSQNWSSMTGGSSEGDGVKKEGHV